MWNNTEEQFLEKPLKGEIKNTWPVVSVTLCRFKDKFMLEIGHSNYINKHILYSPHKTVHLLLCEAQHSEVQCGP